MDLRRPRFRLIALMGVVLLAAGLLAAWRHHDHRRAVARARADLLRTQDRLDWSRRMRDKGYLSAARLDASRLEAERARTALLELGETP